MAVTEITLRVLMPITVNSVDLPPGDYPGDEIIRSDVNAPAGRRITHVLHALNSVPHQPNPMPLDVTGFVQSGDIEVI